MEKFERVATLAKEVAIPPKEVAIPPKAIYRAIEEVELKAFRPNGCRRGWRIRRDVFMRWVAEKTY